VEDDLKKPGVKRWRKKALEREEWASIIKEAKAKLKGAFCYRKKEQQQQTGSETLCTRILDSSMENLTTLNINMKT
jgi:hypothetical protein